MLPKAPMIEPLDRSHTGSTLSQFTTKPLRDQSVRCNRCQRVGLSRYLAWRAALTEMANPTTRRYATVIFNTQPWWPIKTPIGETVQGIR